MKACYQTKLIDITIHNYQDTIPSNIIHYTEYPQVIVIDMDCKNSIIYLKMVRILVFQENLKNKLSRFQKDKK